MAPNPDPNQVQWLLWHDLVAAGSRFTAYQMDALLLDVAPLAVLAASGAAPAAASLGLRWLLLPGRRTWQAPHIHIATPLRASAWAAQQLCPPDRCAACVLCACSVCPMPHTGCPYSPLVPPRLLARLYLGAGAVKLLSCDASWRDLSAVAWHLQSQPLPNPVGAAAHLALPPAALQAVDNQRPRHTRPRLELPLTYSALLHTQSRPRVTAGTPIP